MRVTVILAAACLLIVPSSRAEKTEVALPGAKTNPFFALCMDMHDAKKRTLEQQAELLKELGYAGAGHVWLKHVPERLKTLDEAGLKLFQIYTRINVFPNNARPYDPGLKEIFPLLKGRGTQIALLMSGLKRSDVAGDPRAVELIREIAGMAEASGVRIVLYPHSGDWLERVEDAVRVAEKVNRPNVGVMFNLCHWLKVDEEKNLGPLLESAMPRLFAVSINGADRAAEIRKGQGNWIQPLDRGSFDIYAFLKALEELGYTGPVGLQCYGIRGDARDHLTRSMSAWREFRERLKKSEPAK